MNNCFIYCRKSSEEANKQVQSIQSQKEAMKGIAIAHGFNVVDIIIDEKSAMKPNLRKGFNDMLARIKAREASVIVTWKTDRLSRNPLESGTICQLLQDSVISKIVTIEKTFTPSESQILFTLESAMASEYSRNLAMNVKRGQATKLDRGIYPAAAPIGYLNVGDKKGEKDIAPDPAVFPVLKKLWDILKTEKPQLAELYRIMKDKYPLYFRGRAEVVAFSSFHRIFHNPFYCGLFKWQDQYHVGSHKKMLTQSEFDEIQKHLKRKDKNRKRTLDFDYKGLFKCGTCEACITAERIKKKIKEDNGGIRTYDYYKCAHHKVGIDCKEKSLSEVKIEEQVLAELEKIALSAKEIDIGKRYLAQKMKSERALNRTVAENIGRSIAQQKQKITQLEDNLCFEADAEVRELMKSKLAQARIDLRRVEEDYEAERSAPKEKLEALQNQLDVINGCVQKFQNGGKTEKQRLVKALGSNWRIKDRRLHYDPYFLPSAIKTAKESLAPAQDPFEPTEAGGELKKLTSEEISSLWRRGWDSNPRYP